MSRYNGDEFNQRFPGRYKNVPEKGGRGMRTGDDLLRGRIEDLSAQAAARGCYLFSDFLTPAEQSLVLSLERQLPVPLTFSGGFDQAERRMVGFGAPEEAGYEIVFPITVLEVRPLNEKFSDTLTHRDFLGAILNLGIDRKLTGDILTDGSSAWVFAEDHISDFIADSLTRVKHTAVSVRKVEEVPDGVLPQPQTVTLTLASLRLDLVISKAFHIPRKDVLSLLKAERVFVNSRLQTKATYILREKDLISVRGYGRVRYLYTEGDTRKGNLRILAERY